MRHLARRYGLFTVLVGALAFSACGGDGGDPLAGTWTYSGHVPAIVNIRLTFNPDQTLTFVEDVAPPTTPAGYVSDGCVTTHTFFATYAETSSGDTNTLTWTFTGGTANAVSGCGTASSDSPGTPMTAEGIAAYTAEGLVPPTTETFTVTPTTLVLTPPAGATQGTGLSSSTTFTKLP